MTSNDWPSRRPYQIVVGFIVIGTHGRSGLANCVLGSVAEQVVRDATTSVHIVRPANFVRRRGAPESEPLPVRAATDRKRFDQRRTYVDRVARRAKSVAPASTVVSASVAR